MSYGDYVEQLTYLLFLKMTEERANLYQQKSVVPEKYGWSSLLKRDGEDLFNHYRHLLEALGKEKGLLGLIFNKSQNKFQDPAKLRRLIVDLIDKETWVSMSADVKGDAYEGLLEKNAQDTKSGAGQYFTPRPLIQAIVDVMAPKPGESFAHDHVGADLLQRRRTDPLDLEEIVHGFVGPPGDDLLSHHRSNPLDGLEFLGCGGVQVEGDGRGLLTLGPFREILELSFLAPLLGAKFGDPVRAALRPNPRPLQHGGGFEVSEAIKHFLARGPVGRLPADAVYPRQAGLYKEVR
jgi:hypothetical protein